MRTRLPARVGLALAALGCGCAWVELGALDRFACSDAGTCAPGWVCSSGLCLLPGEVKDAGGGGGEDGGAPDAGSDGGELHHGPGSGWSLESTRTPATGGVILHGP